MKRSVLWGTATFVILLFISGWAGYSRYEPEPPTLRLIVNRQTVEIKPGSYSLEKWGRVATADTFSAPTVDVRDASPIVVTSDEIKLKFDNEPVSVKFYLWEMETGKLIYTGYPLKLKESNLISGDYALEIRAKWENGYVLYNTRIIVDQDEE